MKKAAFIIAIYVLIAGCAPQAPLLKQTASGWPEGSFLGMETQEVQAKVIDRCASKGWIVEDVDDNQIICSREMTGASAVAWQLALGNAYSTTPVAKARFVLYGIDSGTKLSVYMWAESQMPYGQTKTAPLNNRTDINTVQNAIFEMGGR